MKKTIILFLSIALGICLPIVAMNQDQELARALEESKQTAYMQELAREEQELQHALALSRSGTQADRKKEDAFQKELKRATELSLKESRDSQERAAFARAIAQSLKPAAPAKKYVAPRAPAKQPTVQQPRAAGNGTVRNRAATFESENLARRLQAQEDAKLAQELAQQTERGNRARKEQERKQEAAQNISWKIEYAQSHVQEGSDCGYWALWNAIHGGDADYAQKKAPLVEWRKIMIGLGHPKENINDGDIEHLGCLTLKIDSFMDEAPITIIPNIMQTEPITKQSNELIVRACPQSYVTAMRKLQTLPNTQHAFIVGNAQHVGYKEGKGGHWISVRAVKKNNVITWYVQDSGGDGKGQPAAETQALIGFIMNSDYKFIQAMWQRDIK